MPLELERAGVCHIGKRKSRVFEQMQAPVNRLAPRPFLVKMGDWTITELQPARAVHALTQISG